jgi:hypothetical protein
LLGQWLVFEFEPQSHEFASLVPSLSELQAVFRDRPELCFRHIGNCERAPFMRWQAGRMRCIEVESVRGWIFVLFVCEIGKTGLT